MRSAFGSKVLPRWMVQDNADRMTTAVENPRNAHGQGVTDRITARTLARLTCVGLAVSLGAVSVNLGVAQVEVISNREPHAVFSGSAWQVPVVLRNPGRDTVEFAGVTRLFQTSSSTAAPLSETNWKNFRVLAGQTILESAELTFPNVRSETRFLVQWTDAARKVIGSTEVMVYPTNLLSALKPLAGEQPIGVLDPQDQFKPLLKAVGVDFEDLAERELDSFSGRLAVLGPFASTEQVSRGFTERVGKLADKGAAVVWILPPEKRNGRLKPTFYSVPIGKGTVVVAQPQLCSGLTNSPLAQLNLVRLAQLAVHPDPLNLPSLTSAP